MVVLWRPNPLEAFQVVGYHVKLEIRAIFSKISFWQVRFRILTPSFYFGFVGEPRRNIANRHQEWASIIVPIVLSKRSKKFSAFLSTGFFYLFFSTMRSSRMKRWIFFLIWKKLKLRSGKMTYPIFWKMDETNFLTNNEGNYTSDRIHLMSNTRL